MLQMPKRGEGKAAVHGALAPIARIVLSAFLVATLLPAVPASSQIKKAEALTGTSNYADMFTMTNRWGTPGSIAGNTLTAASSNGFVVTDTQKRSSAAFVSKSPVSLLCSWDVHANVQFVGFSPHSSSTGLMMNYNFGLMKNSDGSSLDGVAISGERRWAAATNQTLASMGVKDMVASQGFWRDDTVVNAPLSASYDVIFSYSSGSDTAAMNAGIMRVSWPNVKADLGNRNNAYLMLMGTLSSSGSKGSAVVLNPQSVKVTFQSMSLPNLNPAIRSLQVFDESGNLISQSGITQSNQKVRVVCKIHNNSASSAGEQFAMHFKLDPAHTKNIVPFVDGSHPIKVNGSAVSGYAVNSANGVPFTLKGTNNVSNTANDTTIEYWATINQSNGGEVTVGQTVVDDAMTEPVEMGVKLGEPEVRALLEARYSFLSAVADEPAAFEAMAITNEAGQVVAAIDKGKPATYTVRYKVVDGEGNTTLLRLRYTLVDESKPAPPDEPSNPDTPPAPDKPAPDEPALPGPPTVTVTDPENPGPVRPLRPAITTRDEAGLQHSVIEDTIVVGVRSQVMGPADFATLFAKRYAVASTLPDGKVQAGPVALYDDGGGPVASVDRSRAGVWHIEQLFTDSAGNTTLLRVVYDVRDEYVKTDLPTAGTGAVAGGDGAGSGAGTGDGSRATRLLHELAQTSDCLGGCPLHPLFLLMMVLVSAYGLMKLRLESLARRRLMQRRRRAIAAMISPVGTITALSWSYDPSDLAYETSWPGCAAAAALSDERRDVRLKDGLLFLLVTAAALVVAANGLCPFDWLWAGAVALVCAFWLVMLARKIRATNRKLEARA